MGEDQENPTKDQKDVRFRPSKLGNDSRIGDLQDLLEFQQIRQES